MPTHLHLRFPHSAIFGVRLPGVDPYLTEKLEKVKMFALHLCFKQWDLDYPSLHFISDLPTLATRLK